MQMIMIYTLHMKTMDLTLLSMHQSTGIQKNRFPPQEAPTNLLLEHIGSLCSHTTQVAAHQLATMIWTFGQTTLNHVSIGTRHRMMEILDKMRRRIGQNPQQIWAIT